MAVGWRCVCHYASSLDTMHAREHGRADIASRTVKTCASGHKVTSRPIHSTLPACRTVTNIYSALQRLVVVPFYWRPLATLWSAQASSVASLLTKRPAFGRQGFAILQNGRFFDLRKCLIAA